MTQRPLQATNQDKDRSLWCSYSQIKKAWIYDQIDKSYFGEEIPNTEYSDFGETKSIPYHLPKPFLSYYNEAEKHWKCKRLPDNSRAETPEQELQIGIKNSQWVYQDDPSVLVRTLVKPPKYDQELSTESEDDIAAILRLFTPEPVDTETPTTPRVERSQPAETPEPRLPQGVEERPIVPAPQQPTVPLQGGRPPNPPTPDPDSDNDSDNDMANNSAKISPPETFTGDRTKSIEFLADCELYMGANATKFTDNNTKIFFALSYMKGGTAGPWKLIFLAEHQAAPKTWAQFVTAFEKSFKHAALEATSRRELDSLRQGSMTADEFVAQFNLLAAQGRIMENNSKVMFFQNGLNRALRDKVSTPSPSLSPLKTGATELSNLTCSGAHPTPSIQTRVTDLPTGETALKILPSKRLTSRSKNARSISRKDVASNVTKLDVVLLIPSSTPRPIKEAKATIRSDRTSDRWRRTLRPPLFHDRMRIYPKEEL